MLLSKAKFVLRLVYFSAFETDSQFRTEFQKKEVLDFRN